jgi:hypothetical protein
MESKRFFLNGETVTVVSQTATFWITDSGVWIRKSDMRTVGDGQLAVPVRDGVSGAELDRVMHVHTTIIPRITVMLADLGSSSKRFEEFLAENGEALIECITTVFAFLENTLAAKEEKANGSS